MTDSLPPDKRITPPTSYTLGGRTLPLETACTYKLTQTLGLLAKVSDEIKLPELLLSLRPASGSPDAGRLFVALLPDLFTRIPDTVLRVVAVLLIPNAELQTLFDQPGGIAARVDAEMKRLQFEATGAEVAELAALCVPLLGLDALKNALPPLLAAVNHSLSATQPP